MLRGPPQELEKMTLGRQIFVWNVVFGRLTTSESLSRGLDSSSCLVWLLAFPISSSRLVTSLLPWLYTSPVSCACSISVSDLRGTHLHRQSVYHLWWLNQCAKQTHTNYRSFNCACKVCSLSYITGCDRHMDFDGMYLAPSPNQICHATLSISAHTHTHTHTELVTLHMPMRMSSTDTSDSYDEFFLSDNSKLPERPLDGATLHCGEAPSRDISYNLQLSLKVRL